MVMTMPQKAMRLPAAMDQVTQVSNLSHGSALKGARNGTKKCVKIMTARPKMVMASPMIWRRRKWVAFLRR